MEHLSEAVRRTAQRLGLTPQEVNEVLDVYLDEAAEMLQEKKDIEDRIQWRMDHHHHGDCR